MAAPEYHTYAAKVVRAGRRADADATPAQREAGNARVGRLHIHGFRVSIEYPKGAIRRGKSPDGKTWSRVVQNPYGYIRGTDGGDGEHLDVWLGDHPESQLVFCFDFLTADGEHDEIKAVMATRNLAEAKAVIARNYPDGFVESRVGEVRGYFMPQFREYLKREGVMKKCAGYFCRACHTFHHDRTDDDGCPACDEKKAAAEDAPAPRKSLPARALGGLRDYGAAMSGVTREDVKNNPVRTLLWSVPKNVLTTPVYAPFTQKAFPKMTKWTGRALNGVVYGTTAAGIAAAPFVMRAQAAQAAGDAALDAGYTPEQAAEINHQVKDRFFTEIVPALAPKQLGGDATLVGDAHRSALARLALPYFQQQMHAVSTNGPAIMPGEGGKWVGKILDGIRSLTPGGALATAAMYGSANPTALDDAMSALKDEVSRGEALAERSPLAKLYGDVVPRPGHRIGAGLAHTLTVRAGGGFTLEYPFRRARYMADDADADARQRWDRLWWQTAGDRRNWVAPDKN